MGKLNVKQIKKLREATGAGVMRAKQVLEETNGDEKKALSILKKEGFEKVEKKAARETKEGRIFSYVHFSGKVASLVELFSETDFVARNDLFTALGRDIAMQVASMGEKDLAKQDFIKDSSKKVGELIKEVMAKTGENIRLGRVFRVELGIGK